MNIVTNAIDYAVNGNSHKAYFAHDEEISAPKPGIIIVHEWWGINDYIRRRAHMLAELGYAALAIDMYGDGKVAENPDEAGELMNKVKSDMATGTVALEAGYKLLCDQASVDESRAAAIGYCFGGAMVLHMARIGMPLKAVASFHGALGSFHTAEPGGIKAKILVNHGEADSMVTMDDVASFKAEMDAAQASYEVKILTGARHSFSNPDADGNAAQYGLDLGFQAEADNASWQAMRDLFKQVL